MALFQTLKGLLEPTLDGANESFSLDDRGEQPETERRAPVRLAEAQNRTEGVLTHIENLLTVDKATAEAITNTGDLSGPLKDNLRRIKALFRAPQNMDLIVREVTIATQPPTPAAVCFLEGMVDKVIVNNHILQPLMLLSHLDHHVGDTGESGTTTFSLEAVLNRLLPGHQVSRKHDLASAAEAILSGDTILLFEGQRTAVAVETKGFPTRNVGTPKVERVIHGSRDAFVEAFRVNVALVRRRLKDPRVVTEVLTIGEISHNYVAVMYIDGLTSPKLVTEVKRRIESIKVDVIMDAGVLQQYLEDSPSSLLPGMLATERPDRTAAYLSEGHVAILLDNSPYALIGPITFWSLLQTSEDYNLRAFFGTFLRYIRMAALIAAMVIPAIYIAVVNYHPEMLPTDLMLFIAASRENIPMPTVVELLLMELSFELIREAGTRIPGVIGPTVGLVASLVLGQAAAAAKVVSPLMIVVVAITGLASFGIPGYLTSFGIRSLRFILLIGATVLGFYGIAAILFVLLIYTAGMRSFGVPYLSPVAPVQGGIADVTIRPPLYQMEMRPGYTRPLNRRRQKDVARAWDPAAKAQVGKDDSDEGGTS